VRMFVGNRILRVKRRVSSPSIVRSSVAPFCVCAGVVTRERWARVDLDGGDYMGKWV
jgi:UDP-N-acetylglucosamine enolpyruvyl transferase